ncbi:MAG: IPTL-CTERM sorting domain-containing protein, partial [Parahaliea sp.]
SQDWEVQTWADFAFTATFSPTAVAPSQVVPVPTLGAWALGLLPLALGWLGWRTVSVSRPRAQRR